MKLNNKGFAISGILYSLLILFLALLLGILTVLATSKFSFDKLKSDIINELTNGTKAILVIPDDYKEISNGSAFNILEGVYFADENGNVVSSQAITYTTSPNFDIQVSGTYIINYKTVYQGRTFNRIRTIEVQ